MDLLSVRDFFLNALTENSIYIMALLKGRFLSGVLINQIELNERIRIISQGDHRTIERVS